MQAGLWTIQAFLAIGALGGIYHFLVVRRCRFALWLVANTCSLLILLFPIVSLLKVAPVTFTLAAVIFLYGVEGLVVFGWRFHSAIIVPQVMHIGMISLNILLWMQEYSIPNIVGWGAGLCLGFILRYFQRRLLRMRHDTTDLARDPVIGHIFARIIWINDCDIKGGRT